MTAKGAVRTCIVTGAGRGIGRGVALALGAAGVSVAAVDIDAASARETADLVVVQGGVAWPFTCDVSARSQVREMVDAVVEHFGAIDALVNNAQVVHPDAGVEDLTEADVRAALDSGFWGTFHCMQVVFPHLIGREGRIVNVGSAAGTHGVTGLGGYAAAKEAIRGLTKVAALEWGQHGITVNVICPAAATPAVLAWAELHPEKHARSLAERPIQRDGNAELDIGPAVVFLTSRDAGFITGETLMVNGGRTVSR